MGENVSDYHTMKQMEEDAIFQEENEKYLKLLNNLTLEDVERFEEEGIIPNDFLQIVQVDSDMRFKFIKLPHMSPTTGGNIFDDIMITDNSEREFENALYENN